MPDGSVEDVDQLMKAASSANTSVLPKLTAGTDLGAAAVTAYANRQGVDPAAFLDGLGPTLTPEQVGKTIVELIVDPGYDQDAYLLTPTGLTPIG